ncbi:MAG: 1-deoxy-D-xylulose-5-phosphate synthase [Muribaculaceae bacterium]|nr:1-deoxy-D-xylulose-5-phosphate synthase [Muribaculaceae bacterium]
MLSRIDSPADLRALPVGQLPQVCADIREFLINSLSKNPGHFASSMGAVELTVALHYVFNTPYDRIVWDVGHQAYGHKLLTGRRDRFHTNRKLGGLSGFPNPDESEYDTFSAGHASNSISAALGMAVATEMNTDEPRRNIVAVIGDASIGGGLAFEGLNNAANTPNNLLIILNDNDMSIDDNVGSLHKYLAQINTSRRYNNFRFKLYRGLKKLHLVSDRGRGSILRFNNSLKALLSRQQNIFEGLNIRYFGPIDGHDTANMVKVLSDIKDMTGPKILHVKTVKGKGFEAAEQDPTTWHAPGKFNPEAGERPAGTPGPHPPKYQDVFGKTLLELAKENKKISGITAAMLSGTSLGIMREEMPDRVFDVGISEEHAVTFAGGLAKEGQKPYVAIYSAFLQRAYDQIINDVALQRLPVVFCIDRAGLVGEDGATHHGVFDMTYMRAIPGMTVAAPSSEEELRDLLYTSSIGAVEGPMAIRYPRGNGSKADWQTPMKRLPVGKGVAVDIKDGAKVALLSIGTMLPSASDAVRLASEQGVATDLYDMRYVKPIDEEILKGIVAKGQKIVTVEDGALAGGFGSAVIEWLADNGYSLPVRRIGIPDGFVAQGTVKELHALCGLDSASIAEALIETAKQ